MPRPSPITFFKQSLKSQSYHADELINIYLLRPLAALIVWLIYPTRVTPNQLTMVAILVGLLAAYAYSVGTETAVIVAGLLVTTKDLLDDADGQLARAKESYSRRGRFLDSIGDFVVNLALFSAIAAVVYNRTENPLVFPLGFMALLGITLRVSYHVFYQASYLHLENRYKLNRITEEITEEDRLSDAVALRLQQVFLLIYGWQDRLMYRVDGWCRAGVPDDRIAEWYSDRPSLRISGLLGFGTEYAVLTICSLFDSLHLYLLLNVLGMNFVLLVAVMYRRVVVRRRMMGERCSALS